MQQCKVLCNLGPENSGQSVDILMGRAEMCCQNRKHFRNHSNNSVQKHIMIIKFIYFERLSVSLFRFLCRFLPRNKEQFEGSFEIQ